MPLFYFSLVKFKLTVFILNILLSTVVRSMYIKYLLAFSRRLTILFIIMYVSVVQCGQQCASSEKFTIIAKKLFASFLFFSNLAPIVGIYGRTEFSLFFPIHCLRYRPPQCTYITYPHSVSESIYFLYFTGPFTSYKYFIIYLLLSAVQEIRDLLPATFLKTGIPAQQRFQIRQENEYSNTKEDFFLDCLMRQISTMLTKIDRCWP